MGTFLNSWAFLKLSREEHFNLRDNDGIRRREARVRIAPTIVLTPILVFYYIFNFFKNFMAESMAYGSSRARD